MSVSITNSAKGGNVNGGNSYSQSFDCMGGQILLFFITSASISVDTPLYNGVSMTYSGVQITSPISISGNNSYMTAFTLASPTSGSNNITFTASGDCTGVACSLSSISGVQGVNGATGGSGSITMSNINEPSSIPWALVGLFGAQDVTASWTAGSGETIEVGTNAGFPIFSGAINYLALISKIGTGSGNQKLNPTYSFITDQGSYGLQFLINGSVNSTGNFFMFMN